MAQCTFALVTERSVALSLLYIPSEMNSVDCVFSLIQDYLLRDHAVPKVLAECAGRVWGENGHYVSHALDGNIMRDKNLRALKHFTPYSTPRSAEMNVFFYQDLRDCDMVEVNAYVFPPFGLILYPLFRLLLFRGAVNCYISGTETLTVSSLVAYADR